MRYHVLSGFFQAGKRISTLTPLITAGTATYFSFFNVISNIIFTIDPPR
jgi:hypothetical protein